MKQAQTPPSLKPDRAFWDRIAPHYAAMAVADESAYREKLAMTQACFKPDMEVLELGCGTGSTALEHAPHLRHILATDLSGEMLDFGREKAAKAGIPNITFQQTSVEDLQVAPLSMDAVLALSIIHLLNDPKAAVNKIHTMLKPGGYFVSNTFCFGDSALHLVGRIAPFIRRLGYFPNFQILREDELVAMVENAGFTIERRWQAAPRKAVFIVARKAANRQSLLPEQ